MSENHFHVLPAYSCWLVLLFPRNVKSPYKQNWRVCVCVVQVRCNTWEHHPVWSEHRHCAHHRLGCSLWMCCCHPALTAHVRAEGGLPWYTEDLLLWCLPQVSLRHIIHAHHNNSYLGNGGQRLTVENSFVWSRMLLICIQTRCLLTALLEQSEKKVE